MFTKYSPRVLHHVYRMFVQFHAYKNSLLLTLNSLYLEVVVSVIVAAEAEAVSSPWDAEDEDDRSRVGFKSSSIDEDWTAAAPGI